MKYEKTTSVFSGSITLVHKIRKVSLLAYFERVTGRYLCIPPV